MEEKVILMVLKNEDPSTYGTYEGSKSPIMKSRRTYRAYSLQSVSACVTQHCCRFNGFPDPGVE